MSQRATPDAWAATNVMTQMATRMLGTEQYLGRDDRTLGAKVADNAYELFTICPPAEALALHFEQQQPTYIAVHDIGAAASASFVTGLATALKQPLQRLTMRQQGSGATLAQLSFIELPSTRGIPVRVYATSTEAEPSQRRQIAESLLAFARLGVLLVGAPSEHLVAAQLGLLRDRVLTVPWNNRDLLLVPRAPTPRLEEHARRLTDGTLVRTKCAEPAASTNAIWGAVHVAWGRLRAGATAGPESAPAPAPAPAPFPAASRPQVAAPAPATSQSPAADATIMLRSFGSPARAPAAAPTPSPAVVAAPQGFDAYAQACAALPGVHACLVFDRASPRALAQAGRGDDPGRWLPPLAALMDAAQRLQDAAGSRGDQPLDVVTTHGRHLLLLRTLPRRVDLGMVLVIDKALGSPAPLRQPLQRLDAMLDQ